MNRPTRFASFALIALSLPALAQAQRIERTFTVPTNTILEVRNLNGRVEIEAWNRPQVRVVALKRSRAVEVHMDQAANRLHVHTHLLQNSAPASERVVDYEIWAPATTRLKINLEAGALRVENFSEDTNVDAVTATALLRNLSGHTAIKTLNGSVEVRRCSGRMEANSIGGSLSFYDNQSRYLVVRTTSGDIYYEGGFRSGGSYDLLSHEGTIDLLVPADSSFELNANSTHGQVINDFSLTPHGHGRRLHPESAGSLLGTVLTGDAMLRLTSFSGTIRLRKQ